ncbi:anti-sigma factor [Streptomyces sp. NBC_01023]|uniref:anti-sigma factor n=1 Tax=Streptomyces sp. NBC_01023 TaxID=2903724 RepID=UPI00386F40BC|nr:anti-sigma factor [Streptomyces sp. NBC_01023]
MNSADLHTLTGAYVLHALTPQERTAFERHLAVCPACAMEVRELAATAARLGQAVAVTPPPALKERVLARIATEYQEPPRTALRATAGARRGRVLARFALAACVAAAAGSVGIAVWQHQEASDARAQVRSSQQQAQDLASVLAAPDAKITTGRLKNGGNGTVVVSHQRDQAAFLASALPEPPSGKVYELWYNDGGTMRAAGLLEPSGGSRAALMSGPVGSASGMGITVEPAGGSRQPTSKPLALMNFAT